MKSPFRWWPGAAVVVVVAMVGVGIPAASAAASPAAASSRMLVNGHGKRPDASVRDHPARLVAAARKPPGAPLYVTTARWVRGTPVITRVRATSVVDAEKKVADAQNTVPDLAAVGVDSQMRAAVNDPASSSQYSLSPRHLGGSLEQVRAVSTGVGVQVAVVDTGVDASHPDLAGRVLPGVSILDGVVRAGGGSTDDNSHGTHVAGIIAALTDNGVGVASLAPGATVLPVKALNQNGAGWESDIARGVVFAADAGAQVINLSLGGPTASGPLRTAIAYAQGKGAVVVAATGNFAQQGNPVTYPAALPGVVGVGAVDASGNRGGFSSFGSFVSLTAPGVGILSTLPGGRYGAQSGTSMASPSVAAALAVLAAASPTTSWSTRLDALYSTAWDRGAPGRDDEYGYGVMQVLPAVQKLVPIPPIQERSPTPTPVDPVPLRQAPVGKMSITFSTPQALVPVGAMATLTGKVTGQPAILSQGRVAIMSGTTPLVSDIRVAANGTYTTKVKVVRDVVVSARFVAPQVTLSTGTMLLRAQLSVNGLVSRGALTVTVANCVNPVTVRLEQRRRGGWVVVKALPATAGKPVTFATTARVTYRFVVTGPGYSSPLVGAFVGR